MKLLHSWTCLWLVPLSFMMCGRTFDDDILQRSDDVGAIEARLQRYASVQVADPRPDLPERRRQLIAKLVEAASYMDPIFWRQSDRHALAIREELRRSSRPVDRLYLRFLEINYGPFDRQLDNDPFIGTRPKPHGAGFYPADLTRAELEEYLEFHPEAREELLSPTTVVRRQGDQLVAVPYSQAYQEFLQPAAAALREAATYAAHDGFRRYLELRADALLSDDFYESDVAWVQLEDNPVDIIIGPIETYEDQLMGVKTAYEGIVLLRDGVETEKLAIYQQHLNELEQQLPVPPDYKKKEVGLAASLGVFNAIYRSGDANAGVKTIAIALPNDERVRQEHGARRLQLKGAILAKYEKILQPIAERLLVPEQARLVDGEAFFTNVLLHEIAHPLGLNYVRSNPERTVREALQETYSAIEEAKADIVGLSCVDYFLDRKTLRLQSRAAHYVTFVASILRSVRFGAASAHGKANMVQWNTLVEQGAVVAEGERYRVRLDRFPEAVRNLARELLLIEGDGDLAAARALLDAKAAVPADLQQALESLGDIPVDLEFEYGVAAEEKRLAAAATSIMDAVQASP